MGILRNISILFACICIISAADVKKTKYVISSIKSTPFLMEGNDKFEGFMKDVTDELCKRLDGDCEIKLVNDGKYGAVNSTGHWTGMMGELLNKECDMVVADLTINSERVKVVDFSRSMLMSNLVVVHKMKSMDSESMMSGDFFSMLRPMSPLVWIAFLVIMFMHMGLISLVETKMMVPRGEKGIIMAKCPRSIGGRFMSMMFLVWLVMFVAVYISSLTAQRMAKINTSNTGMKGMTFSTLEEMVNHPGMKYGFVGTGSTAMFFKKANNPMYKHMHEQVMKWQTMTSSMTEGLMRVMEDEDANFAFIMESKSAEYMVGKHCELYIVPETFGPEKGFCIAMRKDNTIMPKINVEILSMKEEGLMEELYKKWWKPSNLCHHKMHHMDMGKMMMDKTMMDKHMTMDNTMTMHKPMTGGMMNGEMMTECMDCHQVTMLDMGCMYLFTTCGMIIGIMLAVWDSRRNK